MNPKVFVSHSAKEPNARDFCCQLESHLTERNFSVLFDKNLQTGQAWRSVLDEWIWRCDAAVIVLSEAALESYYVQYEATLLRQRWKSSDGDFKLVIVWTPGIQKANLPGNFLPIQLTEIQAATLVDWSETSISETLAQIADELEKVRTREARHPLEKDLIENFLYKANAQGIRDLAQVYKAPLAPEGAVRDQAVALARHLLDVEKELGEARFNYFRSGLRTMRNVMVGSEAQKVVKLVAPFCWVNPEVAIQLLKLIDDKGRRRIFAWRREWPLAERMYLCRTYCSVSVDTFKVATVTTVWADVNELLIHIRKELGQKVAWATADYDVILRELSKLAEQGVAVYLLLPCKGLDQTVIAKIQLMWPEISLFLFDDELTDERAQAIASEIFYLKPELAREAEREARMQWINCLEQVGANRIDAERDDNFND